MTIAYTSEFTYASNALPRMRVLLTRNIVFFVHRKKDWRLLFTTPLI